MVVDAKHAQQIFLAALEAASPVDRAALLDRDCAGGPELRSRVEALLRAHDEPDGPLDRPAAAASVETTGDHAAAADPDGPVEGVGSVLAGRYKLLEAIGEGGMGTVFMAQQTEPVRRLVAVKLIKAGMDSRQVLARFEAERQALALMDHPNIAKVLDAGATDSGRPFFVMELVKGVPITKFCDDRKLTPRQRLELFVPVCQAIQHAHQKGIIHRDVKPPNVLVAMYDDRPVPKVIDFGVAKATGPQLTEHTLATGFGAVIGTLAYMSPEQASFNALDVDTRSDVYGLGVLLYELLTGTTPLDGKRLGRGALMEALRLVREEEAPKPSVRLSTSDALPSIAANRQTEPAKLSRLLRGELDWVVLKALEKDRARRYETANDLARDVGRYLADEVVEARPPSVGYRLRKFVKRNKGRVLAAAAVLIATVVGVAGVVWKYLDAEQQKGIAVAQKQEAQREADKAERASDYLVSIFELADANGQPATKTPRQILDDAEKDIPQKFADQPDLRDKLLKKIGTVEDKLTATAPLAMILEASGAVQLHSTRDPNQRAVPQTLLYTGDRLTLADDAHVQLIILSDWHKERLRPGTEATIRRKGCEPADAVAERDQDPMMTFVHLPKGTFYMGWGSDGPNGTIQKGVKTEIQEDFEIAVHDVTQGQWQAVMGENPSYFSCFGTGRKDVKDISDEELKLFPVESVSWDDAQAFLQKLNEKERGRGYLYRLPTEAEWEYACRGGATSEAECSHHFYFDKPTDDLSSDQANFNGDFPFGNTPNGKWLQRPTRVGAYPPNKLGLCDMHGNVWQWCNDLFAPGDSNRVVRGGCWINFGSICRAAIRNGDPPAYRADYSLGFRLARVPSGGQ